MDFDSFTKTGALRLAARIQLFWALRGASAVEVRIEEIPGFDGHYQVRSNIPKALSDYSRRPNMYSQVQ